VRDASGECKPLPNAVVEPYASDTGRDAYNDSDGLYEKKLELTLSKERDGYLGLITLDVERAWAALDRRAGGVQLS